MESSVSPKLLLLQALVLLLLAPVQRLQARELGGSTQAQRVGGLPLVLVLPSNGDDDVVVPQKLTALPSVSRPGGLAPPAPQSPYGPHPVHEPSTDDDSSPGVTGGNQKLAPPSPAGNPPPHYRRLGPAADLLRVFWDALLQAACRSELGTCVRGSMSKEFVLGFGTAAHGATVLDCPGFSSLPH